jgi:nicotinamidase-related amidase
VQSIMAAAVLVLCLGWFALFSVRRQETSLWAIGSALGTVPPTTAAQLQEWVIAQRPADTVNKDAFGDVATAALLEAIQTAYWLEASSRSRERPLGVEENPISRKSPFSTFPIRRRIFVQESSETKTNLTSSTSSKGADEATWMKHTWSAHGGWDVVTNPTIVAHEFFVQEQFNQMAIIVVDVWDTHWCKTAAMRVERLLIPPLNRALRQARNRGMLIIHAPTDVVRFMEQSGNIDVDQMRQRAKQFAKTLKLSGPEPPDFCGAQCPPAIARNESRRVLPRPFGCMCTADARYRCEEQYGWSNIHPLVDVDATRDVLVADDLEELISVLDGSGIKRVIYAGVHLNLCIATAKRISMYQLNQSWQAVHDALAPSNRILFARDLVDAFTSHQPTHGRTPEFGLENAIAFLERDPGGFGSVRLLHEVLAVDANRAKLAIAPWGSLLRPHYFAAGSEVTVTVETSEIGSGDRDIHRVPIRRTSRIEKSGVYLWRGAFGTLRRIRLRRVDPIDMQHPEVTAGVYLQVPAMNSRCRQCLHLSALFSDAFLKETLALSPGVNCSIDIIPANANHSLDGGDGKSAPLSQVPKPQASVVSLRAQCAYLVAIPRARHFRRNVCLCGRVQLHDKVLRRHRRGRFYAASTSAMVTLIDGTRGAVLARTPVLWPHRSDHGLDGDAHHAPWPLFVDARRLQALWVIVQSRSDRVLVQQRYTDVLLGP